MSPTHDYILSNQSGASFRSDLNNALAAIVSSNSNSSSPATTYAYQWWADTNTGTLKIRNSANNAWIALLQLDGTITLENGSNTAPALAFRDQLNTGIFRTSNSLGITSEGTTRALFDSSGVTVTNKAIISSTADAAIDLDCGTGSAGGNQKAFIDFKINGTVKANIAVNEANSGNPLELASAGNGAVHAFFDNNLKFSTESFGVRFYGTLHGQNNNGINLGNDNDLQIKVTDTNSTITHNGEGNLFISAEGSEEDLYLSAADDIFLRVQGSEDGIKILGDAQVELAFDGDKKFETLTNGCQIKGQTRYAESGGTFCAFTDVFQSGTISNGNTFTAQTNNTHAGGLVTITTNRRPTGSNNKTIKIFPIVLNSTSSATLGTEISGLTGSSGSSFSVVGTSQGVIVTNTSGLDQRVTVRFDITG